ncbi:hypothetical protein PG984_003483 [Apiospora sp. TS-2023a]
MLFNEVFDYFVGDRLQACKLKSFEKPHSYSLGRIRQFEDTLTHLMFQLGYTIETTAEYDYQTLLRSSEVQNEMKSAFTQLVNVFVKSFDALESSRDYKVPAKSRPKLLANFEAYGEALNRKPEYPEGLKLQGNDCTGSLALSSFKDKNRVELQWQDVDATSFTWGPLNFKQRCGAIVMRKGETPDDVKILFLEKSRLEGVYQLPKGRRFLYDNPLDSAMHEAQVWTGAVEAGDESTDEETTTTGALVPKHSKKLFDIKPKDILFPTRFDVRKEDRDLIEDGSRNRNRRMRNRYNGRDLGNRKLEKTGATLIPNHDMICRTFFTEPSNGVASFMDWYAAYAEKEDPKTEFDDVFELPDRKDEKHKVTGHWLTPEQIYSNNHIALHEKQAVWFAVRYYNNSPGNMRLKQ